MHLRARGANGRCLPLAPSRKCFPSGLHGRVWASDLRGASRSPPCTPHRHHLQARGGPAVPGQGGRTAADPSPATQLFLDSKGFPFQLQNRFLLSKSKENALSPPLIFSRFQCGKQIRALKHLLLAGGGGGGSFLLIKNKLSRAPWRLGCAGLSAPSATRGYRGPGGHCGPVAEGKPPRARPHLPSTGVTKTFVSL